jgi:hypothetical protein
MANWRQPRSEAVTAKAKTVAKDLHFVARDSRAKRVKRSPITWTPTSAICRATESSLMSNGSLLKQRAAREREARETWASQGLSLGKRPGCRDQITKSPRASPSQKSCVERGRAPFQIRAIVDLKRYLAARQQEVERALDRFLPKATTKPGTIHEAMRYALFAGGKRLRPWKSGSRKVGQISREPTKFV